MASARPKYTLDQFQCLPFRDVCTELLSCSEVNSSNKDRIIELLRTVAEALVWSEQNKQDFFGCSVCRHFLEKDVAAHFKLLLEHNSDRAVTLQLIQAISILSHNLSAKPSRSSLHPVYFHSNNFLNFVIAFPFDFSDEEVAEHFMSWLKGLATSLSGDTLQYYFTKGQCPLLLQAQRFYNYPEAMTKTAARTVALCLFKTKHPEVIRITLESGFFVHLACYIRHQWLDIDLLVVRGSGDSLSKLQMMLEEQTDNFYYLNDLHEIGHPGLTNSLADSLLRYLLLPLLAGSLGAGAEGRNAITIQLAEFLFAQLLANLKQKTLLNGLAAAIFLKEVSPALSALCLCPAPPPPSSFSVTYSPDSFTKTAKESAPLTGVREVTRAIECAQGLDELTEKQTNPIRQEFFGFLRSKDDNLIMLTCLALHALLTCPDAHRCVLLASGLLPQSQVKSQLALEAVLEDLEEPKDSARPLYSSEVMEQLLALLGVDPPFRIATMRLVCQLVFTLAAGGEFGPSHLATLNRAVAAAVGRVRAILHKSHLVDIFAEVFEEELESVSKTNLAEKAQCHAYYLIPLFDDSQEALPFSDRLPCGEVEIARRDVHVFFLLLKLKLAITGSQQFDDFTGFNAKRSALQVGKSYTMDDREFTRCAVKEGRELLPRHFAEDPHFFVLVTPDERKPKQALVTHLTSLRNVEAMVDRSDPRALVLALKEGRDSGQLVLGFDSATLCHKVKRTIDEHRKRTKDRSMTTAEDLLRTSYFAVLTKELGDYLSDTSACVRCCQSHVVDSLLVRQSEVGSPCDLAQVIHDLRRKLNFDIEELIRQEKLREAKRQEEELKQRLQIVHENAQKLKTLCEEEKPARIRFATKEVREALHFSEKAKQRQAQQLAEKMRQELRQREQHRLQVAHLYESLEESERRESEERKLAQAQNAERRKQERVAALQALRAERKRHLSDAQELLKHSTVHRLSASYSESPKHRHSAESSRVPISDVIKQHSQYYAEVKKAYEAKKLQQLVSERMVEVRPQKMHYFFDVAAADRAARKEELYKSLLPTTLLDSKKRYAQLVKEMYTPATDRGKQLALERRKAKIHTTPRLARPIDRTSRPHSFTNSLKRQQKSVELERPVKAHNYLQSAREARLQALSSEPLLGALPADLPHHFLLAKAQSLERRALRRAKALSTIDSTDYSTLQKELDIDDALLSSLKAKFRVLSGNC